MACMAVLTTDQRGNIVATAVWEWMQKQKSISYVPWVLDEESPQFDPIKKARQAERDELLESLERCMCDAVSKLPQKEDK